MPETPSMTTLDGQQFKQLVEAGLTWLTTNRDHVNALNVFPVPDGDTGTNMVLTMQSAWKEIAESSERHLGKMASAVAQGALMGARGNSGVILSQIWRGFARGVDQAAALDADLMVQAFKQARDTAYKGVVRPVEGTILTVIKEVAAALEEARSRLEDLKALLEVAVEAADRAVQHTPELLPVLKEAGVVDSGGKGLFFLLEGMLRFLNGQPLDAAITTVQPLAAMNLDNALEAIEPGQDFEVVVDFRPHDPLDLETFYGRLEEMGTSIQVGEGDGMYRMHIHVPTDRRYEPIDYVMSLGTITKVHMENLLAQMETIEGQAGESKLTLAQVEAGQIAVIAVTPGTGIARVFASLGVAAIVEGGQTMNPSTQDIIDAIDTVPAERVIILPNNKNIIMAAQAAAELTVRQARVVPSRTIPQGLAAMLNYQPDGDLDDVVESMTAAMEDVLSGEITRATRSVEIDGVAVRQGQFIGLLDGKLTAAADDLETALLSLLEQAQAADYELLTLFYGQDLPRPEAIRLADQVRDAYPDLEIEVQEGGQPHYFLILSLE